MKILNLILLAILIVSALNVSSAVLAYVMGSTNYRIQQDSVNFGGTEDSSSVTYKVRDTLGEIATGFASSTSYNLYAGYRQMDEVYISITSPSDCVLSPILGGIGGGISNCFAVWTVTTDSPSGFSATLSATTTGTDGSGYVMKGNNINDYIANYTEGAYNVPDYTWAVTNAAEFGYTATTTTAADLAQAFLNGGGSPCNTGSTMTNDQCWISASSTSRQLINRTSPAISGTSLSVHFRVQINNRTPIVTQGTYVATTTVTALAL